MKIYCCPFDGTNRSAQVRKLLEFGYRQMFGQAMPKIEKTPLGKPFFPTRPNVWFSLTHTKNHVACVLDSRPVGIDLEILRTLSEGVLRHTCAPGEMDSFSFMELWTLKESFIKYTGNNRVSMTDLVFSGSPSRIQAPDGEAICKLYDCVPGCQMAVCGQTVPPDEILFVNLTEKT